MCKRVTNKTKDTMLKVILFLLIVIASTALIPPNPGNTVWSLKNIVYKYDLSESGGNRLNSENKATGEPLTLGKSTNF